MLTRTIIIVLKNVAYEKYDFTSRVDYDAWKLMINILQTTQFVCRRWETRGTYTS